MKRLGLVFLFLLLCPFCYGRIISVDDDAPADFSTIQAAINAASNGDIVLVSDGTYTGLGNRDIDFNGKAITVRSEFGPEGCIIDCEKAGQGFYFHSGENAESVLDGFTIIDGYVETGSGGAILLSDSSGTITNCVFESNFARQGGAIACENSSATITNCVFRSNSAGIQSMHSEEAGLGGAIYCIGEYSSPAINSNIFVGNTADGYMNTFPPVGSFAIGGNGSAIACAGSSAIISNNLIAGNTCTSYGSIHCGFGDVTIINNTIVNNHTKNQLGVGGIVIGGGNSTIINCIVRGNTYDIMIAISVGEPDATHVNRYNNVQKYAGEFIPGEGTIDIDPMFADEANSDFHLLVDSPCINTGDPAFIPISDELDIDGDPRIIGGRVDIGADEFSENRIPVAHAGPDQTMSVIPALISLDGSASYDLNGNVMAYRWRQIAGPLVDLSDANAVQPTFAPSGLGIYAFELVVSDGVSSSFPDAVGIVIGNHAPIADAGPDRYAGPELVLDGTGSYDPDGYGVLTYDWQQVSGPAAEIVDGQTPAPTISFTQTEDIQQCRFELLVSDGDSTSVPDSVSVIIVPVFGTDPLAQTNPPFDASKPTIFGFGGGYNCDHGVEYRFSYKTAFWHQEANIITTGGDWYSSRYEDYGDMLIVFLSARAPDYKQAIQTNGFSAGNGPAIDVANYINLTYADRRYAVNRVTLLDAACGDYPARVRTFLDSSVDGEQCWVDNYMATHGPLCSGALNVRFPTVPPGESWDEWWGRYHWVPRNWYEKSSDPAEWVNGDIFNGGITAGAYVSVAGAAKNLQLGPDSSAYYFEWSGEYPDDGSDGVADTLLFFDEPSYPGRLPEPVILVEPNIDDIE